MALGAIAKAQKAGLTSEEVVPSPERGLRHKRSVYERLLLVEDEATLRRIIARNLTSRGVLVSEAATAEEAVASVLAERPDLMLLSNLPLAS